MKLQLTKPQARALLKGRGVQLKASQIGEGADVPLPMDLERKLARAHRKGMGARLKIDPEVHGAGFFDWIKENVISPIGSVVKAVVPGVLQSVVAPAATAALTKRLGGKGVKQGGSFKVAGAGSKPTVSSNQSLMLTPAQHPVFFQQPQLPDHSIAKAVGVSGAGVIAKPTVSNIVPFDLTGGVGMKSNRKHKPKVGGSFVPAGYSSARRR